MPVTVDDRIYFDARMVLTGSRSMEMRDVEALKQTILNIFRTPRGSRGAAFNPTYGSDIRRWLHDPIDDVTAFNLFIYVLEEVRKHQPLVRVVPGESVVRPITDSQPPGYEVRLVLDLTPYRQGSFSLQFFIDV